MPVENDPRPLDHLVLLVASLGAARQRLTALGFTVAPDGVHPFGTANCCMFFADGTFLEPLAVATPALVEATARQGNVFTRYALGFSDRAGAEGFCALVFGTQNATRDHEEFVRSGKSAGDILNFGRDFVAADGTRDRAEFRLAFALSRDAPDCLFFTCERVAVPQVDRSALLRHPNAVTGIARVFMTAPEPDALKDFFETVGSATAETGPERTVLRSGAVALEAMTTEAFADRTGLPAPEGDAPRFRAVAFACSDTNQVSEHLQHSGIEFNRTPVGIVVPPAPGQGTAFIFQSPENV